ncbi:MAG: hypothetical protein FWD83_00660 [Promicromonosporaceae bacterium]|nr:hypothetical protein [Promicromonosporaceae bacterium]
MNVRYAVALMAAFALVAAGCDSDAPAGTTETGPPTAAMSEPAESVEPQETESEFDPWNQPARTREDYLRDLREGMFGNNLPTDVPIVREVLPEELFDVVIQCMEDAGWPLSPGGGWYMSDDQVDAFDLAHFICYAQHPIYVRYIQPATQAQVLFIREYWLSTWIPCAAQLGIEVTSGPPSAQTFLDQWHGPESWSPSSQVDADGLLAQVQDWLWRECPEMPPSSELFRY